MPSDTLTPSTPNSSRDTVARPVPSWRRLARLLAGAALMGAIIGSVGCASDDSPVAPSPSAIVTFRVGDETYRALLTTAAQIEAARAAQAGSATRIPNGRLVAGAQVNAGYSWHVEDVAFVDATIEVCDGLPSHVERAGVGFGMGRYCPWGAQVLTIQTVR